MIITIRSLLTEARQQLSGFSASGLEAETLLAFALECQRSFLYAHPEFEPPRARIQQFRALLQRRRGGEPLSYITGMREFWSLPLKVNPAVLIPRAETELLVEAALERIPKDAAWEMADLGTGSGAIALALASECPDCTVTATDTSADALAVARANAQELEIENVFFHQGDWLHGIQHKFNLIVSNPPYVASNDPHLHSGDLPYEPELALTSGLDGLAAIKTIAAMAREYLAQPGWLLLEHGYDQGPAVREILQTASYQKITTLQDLEGRDRVSLGQTSPVTTDTN